MRQSFTHCQKIIKINGRYVTPVFYHRTVEYDNLLQRRTKTEYTESSIILKLFAYKKNTDLCIVDNVLCLCGRTRRIQWDGHRPIGKSRKIRKKAFRFILRENTDILFLLYTECHQRISSLPDSFRKLVP